MAPARRFAQQLVRIEEKLRRAGAQQQTTEVGESGAPWPSRWLTTTEVAQQIHVSVATIRREVAAKRLVASRIGRRTYRIEQSAVDAWMASRRVAS